MSPIYTYRCRSCRAEHEVRRPMTAFSETAVCPDCGRAMARKFTPPALPPDGRYSYNPSKGKAA